MSKTCFLHMRKTKAQIGCTSGPTQTELYSHRRWLEALNFRFRKLRDCTIRAAKTKALISICVFVFAYAKIRFFHKEAQLRSDIFLVY